MCQRRQSVQLASRLQKWWRSRSGPQAWGLAPTSGGWFLTGLSRQGAPHLRLHTFQHLAGVLDEQDPSGVVQALQQHAISGGVLQGRPRLNMGLPMDQMVSGVLAISATLEPSDWEADVQVEAARALGLGPQEICFDWQVAPLSDGEVTQVHWVACRQDAVHVFKRCVQRAGGQLASVEPVQHAARRAASCLVGGLDALITCPVQDWQFDVSVLNDMAAPQEASVHSALQDRALQDAMQTPVGPCLVSAGLALKAWA